MTKGEQSELVKCKGSVRVIEIGILLYIVGVILLSVGTAKHIESTPTTELTETTRTINMDQLDMKKPGMIEILIGFIMASISLLMIIVASLNAAYYGCFRSAITGTILSLLIVM